MITQFYGKLDFDDSSSEPIRIGARTAHSGNFSVAYDRSKANITIHLLEWHGDKPVVSLSPQRRGAPCPGFSLDGYQEAGAGGIWDRRIEIKTAESLHFTASTGTTHRVATTAESHTVTLTPTVVTLGDTSQTFTTLRVTASCSALGLTDVMLDKGSRLLITRPTGGSLTVNLALATPDIHDGPTGNDYQLRGFTYNSDVAGPVAWNDNDPTNPQPPSHVLSIPGAHDGGAPATTMESFVITAVPVDGSGNPKSSLPVLTSDPRIRIATVDPGGPVLTSTQ